MNRAEERVLKYANILQTRKEITNALGKGWTELQVGTKVVSLARKGFLDKDKARNLVKDTPSAKLLEMPLNPKLKV